jgi:hypothetical protein
MGDLRSAEEHVDRLIPHAESHSLEPYVHVGRAYKGALAICSGNPMAGVETIQDCLRNLHARNREFKVLMQRSAELNIILTQGLMAIGRVDEGIALIGETVRSVGRADSSICCRKRCG